MKQKLRNALLFKHSSSIDLFVLTTDACKFAVGATLEQNGHPVAYLLHRLTDTKTRWGTGDQKLLAVVSALRTCALHRHDRPFVLRTDHEPIKYLQSKMKLNGGLMRWFDELYGYNFIFQHLSGSMNGAADALSRILERTTPLNSLRLNDPTVMQTIQKSYPHEKLSKELAAWFLDKGTQHSKKTQMYVSNYSFEDENLFWTTGRTKRLYVPQAEDLRRRAIDEVQNCPHFGIEKTIYQYASLFYWKGM